MKEIRDESGGGGADIFWDLTCISKNTTFFFLTKKKKRRDKHRGSPKNSFFLWNRVWRVRLTWELFPLSPLKKKGQVLGAWTV